VNALPTAAGAFLIALLCGTASRAADLPVERAVPGGIAFVDITANVTANGSAQPPVVQFGDAPVLRSEERRVGKEC
jgi:hypothetical protein